MQISKLQIALNEPFDIPASTPQQRKLGGKNTYPTNGLRYARAAWQALLEKYKPSRPIAGPVSLAVLLFYHTKSRAVALAPKTSRPDGDNLLKVIKDAATKAGWWIDDAQVYDEHITRYWTSEEERVKINVLDQDM